MNRRHPNRILPRPLLASCGFRGVPVASAIVVAGSFTAGLNHMVTTTGPDGRFAFQPKPGEKKLQYAVAYKQGLAPASKFASGFGNMAPNGEMELVLLRAEPFVGAIQNRDGRPVAGASVWIKYIRGKGGTRDHNPILENVLRDTRLERLFHTATDEQGEISVPCGAGATGDRASRLGRRNGRTPHGSPR